MDPPTSVTVGSRMEVNTVPLQREEVAGIKQSRALREMGGWEGPVSQRRPLR